MTTRTRQTTLALFASALLGIVTHADQSPPGLIAIYSDAKTTVRQVTLLPELGLAAKESPHPAIAPEFTAVFEGQLRIAVPGTYRFFTTGDLLINGNAAPNEIALTAGEHRLRLSYRRQPGPALLGLAWESEHFIREPVPPTVLTHGKAIPLTRPPERPTGTPAPAFRIANALETLNCATCHDANFLATMHHKFASEALLPAMRHAGPAKWHGKPTGPLLAESELLIQLATDLRKLQAPMAEPPANNADDAAAIHMVGTKTGFACIACHGIKHHRSEAESKGPNLSVIAQRVTYDWFVRWMTNPGRLKPGVPMPAFFAAQAPETRKNNIDALWHYMRQGDRMQLPPELKPNAKQFVLKPTTKPMVQRVYIRLPNGRELLRAICVGLPNGTSYCFDAESCQLAYVWTGGFIDMAPHWKNQSGSPTPAVGESFYLPAKQEGLRIGDAKPRFQGYELVNGIPRFEYRVGETEIKLTIDADTDGVHLNYQLGNRQQPVTFVGPEPASAVVAEVSAGTLQAPDFTITFKKADAK